MKRKLNIIAGALMMTAFICVPMLSGCSKTKSVSTETTVEKAAKKSEAVSKDGTVETEKEAEESKLKVMASFYPMYDFAVKIGGDKVKVMDMVPAGTEPHDWEPAATDIKNLEDADVFVYNGAEKGIERVSKFIMPVLLVMVVGIAIFSLTLKTTLDDGTVRTGLQGLKVYLTPDMSGITVQKFLQVSLDAMSQLFFSLSVSMGIMITYGSYVKKDVNLNKAVSQIEIMDTGVAFLAGMMIIPAVFVFSGLDGMSAGPGLMFVSLPNVFFRMGMAGRIVGLLFFLLAGFAALTSCISVLESIAANCMELFHTERKKTTGVLSIIYLIATAVIALGYSIFYVEVKLPNGSTGQLLDIMDYISNSFLMPFISLLSAILIGWIIKPSWIVEEMELNGKKFSRKKLYNVMIRYIMPVIMVILFLQSTGFLDVLISKIQKFI